MLLNDNLPKIRKLSYASSLSSYWPQEKDSTISHNQSREIKSVGAEHIYDDLLHRVMAPKVVHHVAFGAEALATVLWAIKRPMVVVHSNVDRQIVPVIEALLTIGDWTYENSSRLMVSKMSLQILTRPEFLRTGAISAPENLWDHLNLTIFASEALTC